MRSDPRHPLAVLLVASLVVLLGTLAVSTPGASARADEAVRADEAARADDAAGAHEASSPTTGWPMWRRDAARSATTKAPLAKGLGLAWSRAFTPPEPAWRSERLGFDRGLEPIVHDGRVLVGSSRDDSLTALSLETGEVLWRYLAGGPIRFAPVALDGLVLVGSDDGFLHAISSETGARVWRFRAAPSRRKTIGNRRLISLWPVRGGPVLANDAEGRSTVYFAAGVWSFEGVWVWALDAHTGEVRWVNDASGYVFGSHPHRAEAIGGLSPQGYLVVDGDDLFVPCGTAYPARFDRHSGELREFALPVESRLPGGWFAWADPEDAKAARRGELKFDTSVNQERHEDNLRKGRGEDGGLRRVVAARGTGEEESISLDTWPARLARPEGAGEIHTLLVYESGALVVTRDHELLAYARRDRTDAPERYEREARPAFETKPSTVSRVSRSRNHEKTPDTHGLTIAIGASLDDLVALARETKGAIITIEPLAPERLRAELHRLQLLGTRITVVEESLVDAELPPWSASRALVAAWPDGGEAADARFLGALWRTLRPYGSDAFLLDGQRTERALHRAQREEKFDGVDRVEVRGHVFESGDAIAIERHGPLPGSVDYTGGWSSPDALVRAPLGVLWFDDTLGHFKRAPQPMVVGGVLVSNQKTWIPDEPREKGAGYKLEAPIYSDVYTGRLLSAEESAEIAKVAPGHDRSARQPSQYRPPSQKDDWNPPPPVAGTRISPLTLEKEPRAIRKSYGCDGGVDYGDIYTLRSGTAAFYDKTLESGTIHISGPRSGCTNSVIPANGVLNVPFFYEGCTCSYPLPSGLALVSMPETHEQWSIYGEGTPENIRRVGINLGAPGDRMTREGTLWLEHPARSGPSPAVPVTVEPASAQPFYRHALEIEGGRGWPWVLASGVEGLRTLRVESLDAGDHRVRLYFSEPQGSTKGARVFDVAIGERRLERVDPFAEAGGARRGVVRELLATATDGAIEIRFTPHTAREAILCGVEIISVGLDAVQPIELPERSIPRLELAR